MTSSLITGGKRRPRRADDTGRLPPWIWALAALTVLVRLAGLWPPLRADEAGFLLVARNWDPRPDSMFGDYWVDRPPLMLAVVRLADALGGPLLLRVVGAVGMGLVVVLAARVATRFGGGRGAGCTAVVVAAVVCNPAIDLVAVKGEQLALPVVMGSIWATLAALRRRSWELALLAGVLAGLGPSLKQNLVTGMVFAAVAVLGSHLAGRLGRVDTLRLAGAGLAGIALPVAAQAGWAVAAGVKPSAVWYAVYGFRSDAAEVLALGGGEAHLDRGMGLLELAVQTGIAVILAAFLLTLRLHVTADPVLASSTAAVVLTEVLVVVLGGSFWKDYLFTLVPGMALAAALLSSRPGPVGAAMRAITVGTACSCVIFLGGWVSGAVSGEHRFTEVRTGEAVARAAEPRDTLVVFGGRADIQYAAGLRSPYPYLWSLPMRTLDPEYARLVGLLEGSRAPTWLVRWAPLGSWDAPGADDLQQAIEERYVLHGRGCADRPVYLLRGTRRPPLTPDC